LTETRRPPHSTDIDLLRSSIVEIETCLTAIKKQLKKMEEKGEG